MINIVTVLDSIAQTMQKAGCKLSENQRMVLAGALAVWLQKVADDARAPSGTVAVERQISSGHLAALADRGE